MDRTGTGRPASLRRWTSRGALSAFLERIAREHGWQLRYADPGSPVRHRASSCTVRSMDCPHSEALDVTITTSGLRYRLENGELMVLRRSGAENAVGFQGRSMNAILRFRRVAGAGIAARRSPLVRTSVFAQTRPSQFRGRSLADALRALQARGCGSSSHPRPSRQTCACRPSREERHRGNNSTNCSRRTASRLRTGPGGAIQVVRAEPGAVTDQAGRPRRTRRARLKGGLSMRSPRAPLAGVTVTGATASTASS